MDRHNVLIPLRLEGVDLIWSTLRGHRFEFSERDHAHFTAKKNGLHVTVYEKGPKMLVQGNGALDFADSVLGPLVVAPAEA
ncbi:MAG: hypothetical protein ABGZ49_05335 [Akkermansiaceae bacterium]